MDTLDTVAYIRYLLSTYTYVTVYNYYELWLIICTMQLSDSLKYYANNNDKSIFINIFLFL